MILDNTSIKLEAVLAGAGAIPVTVDYVIWNTRTEQNVRTKPQTFRTATNGATDVTILAAPVQVGNVHQPIGIYINNNTGGTVVVTVKTDDGTERIMVTQSLLTTQSLCWDKSRGWYVI